MKNYRKENRERLTAYQKAYRENNPEYVDKGKEYCKRYYQEHKEQLRKYHIKYRRNKKLQAFNELLMRYALAAFVWLLKRYIGSVLIGS